MKKILFDSFALLCLFRKDEGYEFVRDLLVRIANDESEGFISAISVGELYYVIARKANLKNAETAISAIKQMPLQIVDPDFKACIEAASIQAKYALSHADGFAAALAISKKATLVTSNTLFKSVEKEPGLKVKYIP